MAREPKRTSPLATGSMEPPFEAAGCRFKTSEKTQPRGQTALVPGPACARLAKGKPVDMETTDSSPLPESCDTRPGVVNGQVCPMPGPQRRHPGQVAQYRHRRPVREGSLVSTKNFSPAIQSRQIIGDQWLGAIPYNRTWHSPSRACQQLFCFSLTPSSSACNPVQQQDEADAVHLPDGFFWTWRRRLS
jgi:hypothetical protein